MRVFVALNPSDAERERLGRAAAPIRDAGFPIRWLAPENVHLTLKFLGEIAGERVAEVCSAMDTAAAGTGPFRMSVGGFGAFPSLRRPQVVWVGVQPDPSVERLQRAVEDALAELGYPREERPFRPHLTIGRARKGARPPEFKGLDELVRSTSYDDGYEISSLDVMRSRLMPSGALYDRLHRSGLAS